MEACCIEWLTLLPVLLPPDSNDMLSPTAFFKARSHSIQTRFEFDLRVALEPAPRLCCVCSQVPVLASVSHASLPCA